MDITILLVDDEAVDLEWLRRRVAGNEQVVFQSVTTASSGFEALKIMEQQSIDVVLSDIRMPIMSGMEFVRKAKEVNPQVQVVFISGHQDFGFAKEAIQLGAAGYLLKPVDDRELNDMLIELAGKIERERHQRASLSETLSLVNQELVLRWFHEGTPEQIDSHVRGLLTPVASGGSAVALVEVDDLAWKLEGMDEGERHAFIGKVADYIRGFARDNSLGTVIAGRDHRFVVLTTPPEDEAKALLERLIQSFYQSFAFSITVGTGKYTTQVDELHHSYRQAKAALGIKWIVGKNRLIQDASVWSPKAKMAPDVEEVVDRMLQAMLEYDLVTVDDCLLELFGGDSPLSRKNEIYDLIIRINSKLHAELQQMNEHLYDILKWESHQPLILFQFETVHDIISWLRRRFFELSELLYLKRQKQKRGLIHKITEYVKERLDQKITLNEVAAHFGFTPNYLGHLFKAETNQLFSDFLNELRMKRVCELLQDPTKKIYEIADQVGYKNIIYFNRQFKQYAGVSPGEYRKKNKM
ncbi:response regulator [Paenibacillus antri]|uniref:Response regulator n=1 Tax=Paenibacillus antri TaxID=2582848 RepID=A0A5R9G859_9BACL|nr:response regulator [Paenibacillus antri]TLS51259.1 response regulator [Paenibacillus antri]